MSALSPAAKVLVKLMGELPRGPRRDGAFALWLTLRVAEDHLLVPPLPERATRRRLAALEQRLSTLVISAPLRRALIAAITQLADPAPEQAVLVLQQLAAPARDVLGKPAGEAMAMAVRDRQTG
jgi:hypothetical protein